MAIKFLNTVAVDESVLFVDTINDRVGIGTDSPKTKLHVQGASATEVPIVRIGGFGNSGSKLELAETLSGDNMNYGFSFFNDGNSSNTLIVKAHNNSTTGVTAFSISRTNALTTFSVNPVVGTMTAGDNSTRAASTAFVTAAVAAAPQGDITTVTAGTGLTGGGTSGAVTLNAIGGDGITANANDIQVDSTVVRTTGSTMTGTLDFSGSGIGRAITITADSDLDGADASIYLGNAPASYGFDIQYTGTGSGNTNSLDIISTNQGSPVTALKILQDGVTTFSSDATFESNIQVDGEIVQTSTGGENQFASALNMGDNEIVDLADPTSPQEAATKAYVDAAVAGVPQGDITAVTAGTFLTGGGTSGTVTLNADTSKLAHIVDSSNGNVNAGWITVAQANTARRAGEIYVTDGESSDHSYIRIEWMRSYADSNFTVINCGGHANRIQGVRVLQEAADATYGPKYLQVKVTAASNYYVIITAPGTIPNYSDFTAVTPVLENTKTGYSVTGAQLEDLHNSSVGTDEGITVGGDLFVNGGDIVLGGTGRIQGVDTVTDATDAANKAYVDSAVAGVPQGDITAVTAGTGLTGGGTSGAVTLNAIGGDGITANANDIAVDSTVARKYVGTATGIDNTAYKTAFTVNGGNLSSHIRFTVQGTTGSVVVSNLIDLAVNHFQDIQIKALSGNYTLLSVKVISNNNEDFEVQLKTNSGNPVTLALEVFPLGSEVVTFTNTSSFTGATGVFDNIPYGNYMSGSGGDEGDLFIGGDLNVNSGDIVLGGTGRIQGVDTITDATDAANKAYVDAAVAGVPQGDITAVTAGTGMTGGGTTGAVTLNVIGGNGITANANDIAVDATVVRTTGNQTIAGVKAFSDDIRFNNDILDSAGSAGTAGQVLVATQQGAVSWATQSNSFITAATFSTSTGVITGTGGGSAGFTVDIDGRYPIGNTANQPFFLDLEQNTVGTTYGDGVATVPSYYFGQRAGDNDGMRFYAESAVTNDVTAVWEIIDDVETGLSWLFRNKKTYSPYTATEAMKIDGDGDVTIGKDLTITGGDIILSGTGRIQGVDTVTSATDAASKGYVDNAVAGVPQGDITSVAAGNGLTGGGTSGAVTLNVVGGTGITANANDIAIDATVATLAGTQTFTGAKTINTLKIGTANKIQFANNDFIRYDDANGVGRFHFDSDGGTNNASVQAATFVGALTGTATNATQASKIKAGGTGPNTEDLNSVANSVSVGQLEYRAYNLASTNKPPASDNANGVITVGQHSGNYNAQVAFSSDGNMYWRDNPSTSNGSWRKMWDAGNDGTGSGLDADKLDGQQGSYYYAASNPSGYTTNTGTTTASNTQTFTNKSGSNSQWTNDAGYTTNAGDITSVVAGTNLNGGGTSGAVTLNLDTNISLDEVNIGSGIELRESADRADLLQITSATSTWAGLQIRNSSNEGRWSFMTDGGNSGFYDDENNEWAVLMNENAQVQLYHNGSIKFKTNSTGVDVLGNININENIAHGGDSNTYIGFPSNDTWRVVTAGSERLRINSSGNVGIGTTTPDLKLDVISGTNNGIRISATDTSSNWRDISIRSYVSQAQANALPSGSAIYTTNPSSQTETAFSKYGGLVVQGRNDGNSSFAIRLGNGNGYATRMFMGATGATVFSNTVTASNFINSSDERLKENIKEVSGDKVEVNWKTFEFKTHKGHKRYGVIAQELEENHPEFVQTDNEGMKSVAYTDLLIAKIAELESRIQTLENN